ncbi:MAG: VOC family protein [Saprospiraceae bacterium]|nr:VOC family protein [Saprospiraceae bacterium]
MEVDHIIIFSNNQGNEANELVKFGLTEGSNRVHPGQGTRNRKFYFENFFLEIVWVCNESEITSELTAPTRLWERANHRMNGSSPFGLCLVNSDDTDHLFGECLKYRPSYLPEGLSFDIITNEAHTYLPWTCRLPSTTKHTTEEPTHHQVGIKKLTNLKFGIQRTNYQNAFTDLLGSESIIVFENADHHGLTLEFDNNKMGKSQKISSLPLTIEY